MQGRTGWVFEVPPKKLGKKLGKKPGKKPENLNGWSSPAPDISAVARPN